jgi:FKBP-type peptidyl-prolyl cis-trans isomerase SlyD
MHIADNSLVSFHYELKGEDGEVIDRSPADQPMTYLHGHSNIIPGLEKELLGKAVGDKLQVAVEAADAYGEYDQDKCFLIDRKAMPGEVEPGAILELHAEDGEVLRVYVVAVTSKQVEVDANHPLAGQKLFFDVEVASVAAATAEQISQGHP